MTGGSETLIEAGVHRCAPRTTGDKFIDALLGEVHEQIALPPVVGRIDACCGSPATHPCRSQTECTAHMCVDVPI